MKSLFGALALGASLALLLGGAQAQQKKAEKHHNGHEMMPHPSTLKNGVHHFHTTPSGHRVHAKVHEGKIHDLHVVAPNGKPVPVRRVRKVASAGSGGVIRASAPPFRGDSVAQAAVVLIGFTFWDAGQGLYVTFWFPASWVA